MTGDDGAERINRGDFFVLWEEMIIFAAEKEPQDMQAELNLVWDYILPALQ